MPDGTLTSHVAATAPYTKTGYYLQNSSTTGRAARRLPAALDAEPAARSSAPIRTEPRAGLIRSARPTPLPRRRVRGRTRPTPRRGPFPGDQESCSGIRYLSLIVLASAIVGCGGPPAAGPVARSAHGGTLVALPDGQGLAEVLVESATAGRGGRKAKAHGRDEDRGLLPPSPTALDAMSPGPTKTRIKIGMGDNGRVIDLSAEPKRSRQVCVRRRPVSRRVRRPASRPRSTAGPVQSADPGTGESRPSSRAREARPIRSAAGGFRSESAGSSWRASEPGTRAPGWAAPLNRLRGSTWRPSGAHPRGTRDGGLVDATRHARLRQGSDRRESERRARRPDDDHPPGRPLKDAPVARGPARPFADRRDSVAGSAGPRRGGIRRRRCHADRHV